MSVGQRLKNRVRGAVNTVVHGVEYGRHLVRGNRVTVDMSWTRPNTPPVVLVHGFMGTRGTMLPLTRRFQRDGRVVFSYAYGTFNLASIRRSAEDLATHLRAICEKLEVERVDVVGYSMGGLIGLHAVKFLQGHQYIRNLVMMGSPLRGTWVGLAGVATVGAISPSVWQVLPGSPFLEDLLSAPAPAGVRLRQIHAASDAFCPPPGPIEGVAARDYIMLAGGHSSLVVAEPFYDACREFFDAGDAPQAEATGLGVDGLGVDGLGVDELDELEYVFERVDQELPAELREPIRLVANGYEHDAAE
jgi:pimeloyl-ACP methyl ester carboxylesterase